MKKSEFSLKAKIIDIAARVSWVVVVNKNDGKRIGIKTGQDLLLRLKGQVINVCVDETDSLVKPGQVGIFKDLAKRFDIDNNEVLRFLIVPKPNSLAAIQKKLLGKPLSYKETYLIIKDITNHRLNDVAVAFFVASSFFRETSNEELFYLVKAMASTGKTLHFSGIVADKHSIGGLCGNETTPIIVPIVASFGIKIPKTCSRAITSASGTADTFETVAPVEFTIEKLEKIVKKTNGCIIWGAGDVVPSDDRIIEVASQLSIESPSKAISSIMAKKVAMGIKYLVIDIPVQKTAKVETFNQAKELEKMFLAVANHFKIKAVVSINLARQPIGRGIGPALQIRDDLRVLEQKDNRPLDLEKRALELAGHILELTGKAKKGKGIAMAKEKLVSGEALRKFKEIVKVQGGDPKVSSEKISLSSVSFKFKSPTNGKVKEINNHHLAEVCRVLGSPFIKGAGIYLDSKVGDKVEKGDVLFTLYTPSTFRLNLALKMLKAKPIFRVN